LLVGSIQNGLYVIGRPPSVHSSTGTLGVELDEVPDALAGGAVIAVLQLWVARRRFPDVDGRHEVRIADLRHALRMIGVEIDRDRSHLGPLDSAGELLDALADDAALIDRLRERGECHRYPARCRPTSRRRNTCRRP
jgi:hypothetical protein